MQRSDFKNKKRIVLVSDPLTEYGGEQRVLEAIIDMYPNAPVFTGLYCPENLPKRFAKYNIKVLNPFLAALLSKVTARSLRLFLIFVYKNYDFSDYDLIISSGTFFAKFAQGRHHISYVHTPPRFLYGYETASGMRSTAFLSLLLSPLDHLLRLADFNAAKKVEYLVANSSEVCARIKKFYKRNPTIINPPVELPDSNIGNWKPVSDFSYFLIVTRLEKYKNVDIAIEAAKKANVILYICGSGSNEAYLRSLCKDNKNIVFLGRVPDAALPDLYKKAKAFIFPVKDEDFGITPIEAQSFGCPVIAHRSGGCLETVIEGKTGEFFSHINPTSLAYVLENFNRSLYKSEDCIKNSEKYSKEVFRTKLTALVEKCLNYRK